MTSGEWVQIGVALILTLTLGAVLWYACEARKQAKASAKMAREMRLSRQDESRPVLDVHKIPQDAFGTGPEAMQEATGQLLTEDYVWCTLKNIGKGPALNIKAQIKQDFGAVEEVLGTLGIGDEVKRRPLMIIKAHDQYLLEVKYQDVYGRWFSSRRRVMFDESGPHLDTLETGEVDSS